jgi:hypothetical protein
MKKIIFNKKKEKEYAVEAIQHYLNQTSSISEKWKNWLEGVMDDIESSSVNSIDIEDTSDFIVALYSKVFKNFIHEPMMNDKREFYLNGLAYVNNMDIS